MSLATADQSRPATLELRPDFHCRMLPLAFSGLLSFYTLKIANTSRRQTQQKAICFKSRKILKWLEAVGHLVYNIFSLSVYQCLPRSSVVRLI